LQNISSCYRFKEEFLPDKDIYIRFVIVGLLQLQQVHGLDSRANDASAHARRKGEAIQDKRGLFNTRVRIHSQIFFL
jgi:hypothetical protein